MENKVNNSNLLLEPEKLETFITTTESIIIHISSSNSYEKAHIPQAINITSNKICSEDKCVLGQLPNITNLEILFSELGYNKDKHFIVYDDEVGGWAGRFIWLLDSIGHKKYSYLNGGLVAWMREKYPLENNSHNKNKHSFVKIVVDNNPSVNIKYINENLNNSDILLWDARSAEEYSGKMCFAKQGGHIPNAINFEWLKCLEPKHNYRIKENILQELAEHGITPHKEIITYCQNHHRSGLTYLVAKSQNFLSVKAYPGSWAEWGNSNLNVSQ